MATYFRNLTGLSLAISAGLLNVEGSSGTPNLYCKWTLYNNNTCNYQNIFLNYTISQHLLQHSLTIQIDYLDGSSSDYNLISQDFYFNAQIVLEIRVNILVNNTMPNPPFFISFLDAAESQTDTNFIGLGISVGIVFVVSLFLIYLIIKCSKFIIDKRNRNRNRPNYVGNLRNNSIINEQRRLEELKKKKMKKLEILYKNELMPIKYDFNLNEYNSNCTICLEEFKNNSDVMKFSCRHLFHYSCGKSWCEKNIFNLECPNCKLKILPEENVDGVQNELLILSDNRNNDLNIDQINLNDRNVVILTHILEDRPHDGRVAQFSQNINIQILNNPSSNQGADGSDNMGVTRNNFVSDYESNRDMMRTENLP